MSLLSIVIQLIMLVLIIYGIYLVNHYDDMRTSKEKRKDIVVGISLIGAGSFVIFVILVAYFITYKIPIKV